MFSIFCIGKELFGIYHAIVVQFADLIDTEQAPVEGIFVLMIVLFTVVYHRSDFLSWSSCKRDCAIGGFGRH